MITKTLKTETGSLRVSIPENLNELTVGQLIEIQEAEGLTDLKTIAILSGTKEDELKSIYNFRDLSVFNDRVLSLSHQILHCYNYGKLPEYVTFGKKKKKVFGFTVEKENRIRVIKNLTIEPAGAYLVTRDLIADEVNRHIEKYGEEDWRDKFIPSLKTRIMLLAHYFYCRVTGNLYNEQKAEEFKSEILKMPAQDMLPISSYFFLSYLNL